MEGEPASAEPLLPQVSGGDAEPERPPIAFSEEVTKKYDVLEELGQGAYSIVFRVKKTGTDDVLALKRIDSREAPENTPRQVAHETSMMKLAGAQCDHVVRCWEVILEDGPIFNVFIDEFAGGDLIDGLNRSFQTGKSIRDSQLAFLAQQMMAALQHIHSLHIIHRDVKGENFLLDRHEITDPAVLIALADFGMAKMLEPGVTLEEQIGTTSYWAPEVFFGRTGHKVDIWAVGVTVFVLATGTSPFEDDAVEEQVCNPAGPSVAFPPRLSAECQKFIKACFEPDPAERFDATTALKDDWLAKTSKKRFETPTCGVDCIVGVAGGVGQLICCVLSGVSCLCHCVVDVVCAGLNANSPKEDSPQEADQQDPAAAAGAPTSKQEQPPVSLPMPVPATGPSVAVKYSIPGQ